MKRNIIDTKFGGPKEQDILCSSDYKTPQKNLQYFRPGRNEDPWLSYLDQGTSSIMYREAGKCACCLFYYDFDSSKLCVCAGYTGHSENVMKGGMNVWIYPPPGLSFVYAHWTKIKIINKLKCGGLACPIKR